MSASTREQVLAVIPARLASTRLPEKPLKDIAGKTLVQRVWERARSAQSLDRVVVATDSDEIANEVARFGGEVVMTSPELTTGSARVAAAARILAGGESAVTAWRTVVNVQGDMPFIKGELIDRCVDFLHAKGDRFGMVTIATPILDENMYRSPMDVKVVVGAGSRALYFSRAPIPHSRDGNRLEEIAPNGTKRTVFGYKHFGLYVYSPNVLSDFERSDMSTLEDIEKLEQLRLLEMGHTIGVCIVESDLTAGSIEVDTPEDLERSRQLALAAAE